jgi:hypothetical protein
LLLYFSAQASRGAPWQGEHLHLRPSAISASTIHVVEVADARLSLARCLGDSCRRGGQWSGNRRPLWRLEAHSAYFGDSYRRSGRCSLDARSAKSAELRQSAPDSNQVRMLSGRRCITSTCMLREGRLARRNGCGNPQENRNPVQFGVECSWGTFDPS